MGTDILTSIYSRRDKVPVEISCTILCRDSLYINKTNPHGRSTQSVPPCAACELTRSREPTRRARRARVRKDAFGQVI